ncbi:MAG TPA: hypothetical protein DDY22_13620 [Geobacter sp.]|nr:hypothetical protein [Geobacter sp.]
MEGTVFLKDSSTPAKEVSATIAADGRFALDLTGSVGPYLLKASGPTGTHYSYSSGAGTANINPLTSIVVASAAHVSDLQALYANPNQATLQAIDANFSQALAALRNTLKPALLLYGADAVNPHADSLTANHQGFDRFLDHTAVTTVTGVVTMKNKSTNAVFYSAPLFNLSRGSVEATSIVTPSSTVASSDGTPPKSDVNGFWIETTEATSSCDATFHSKSTALVLGTQGGQQAYLYFFNLKNFPSVAFWLPCTMNGSTCSNPGSQAAIDGTTLVMKPYSFTIVDGSHMSGAIKIGASGTTCEVIMQMSYTVAPDSLSQAAKEQINAAAATTSATTSSTVDSLQQSSRVSQCTASCDMRYAYLDAPYTSCGTNAYSTSCAEDLESNCLKIKSCYKNCGSEYYSGVGVCR